MLPYIYIGSLKISMYYLAMFLGYVGMALLMLLPKRRDIYRLSRIRGALFATLVLIGGLAGCKILYVLENIRYVRENGLTLGGFSFFGAALLTPLLTVCFCKPLRMSAAEVLDNTGICGVTMLGTIRLGCFCNGCCGGRIFYLENFDFSFPTQIMECACDFLILIWLLRMEKEPANRGSLYGRFLLAYGTIRFLLEFLRATPKDWLGMSHGQWFAIGAALIGIAWEWLFRRRAAKPEANPANG